MTPCPSVPPAKVLVVLVQVEKERKWFKTGVGWLAILPSLKCSTCNGTSSGPCGEKHQSALNLYLKLGFDCLL